MTEAEHARAEVYVDQTLVIADSDARTAGAARNSIQSRQWAAARMDPDRYGQKRHIDLATSPDGTGKRESLSVYSDEDLQSIIRAGLKATSIEGESKRVDQQTGGHPPAEIADQAEAKDESDLSTPKILHTKPSVTTNEIDSPSDEESYYEGEPEF